jgi:hypothetical protein
MTMMITKFHKLIGSKIFWTLFIALVVVSFVLMYSPQIEQSGIFNRASAAGTVGGKSISYPQFDMMGKKLRAFSQNSESREEFDERVWHAFASQQKADELGIQVSDKDVSDYIKAIFSDRQTGQFSRPAYDNFIQNQFGPGKHDVFETLLKERL